MNESSSKSASSASLDLAIQSTSEDASICKKYAVTKGYWKDDNIGHMVKGMTSRKEPEINRGYYARNESIWMVLKQFISMNNGQCQVISLGAGLDTLFWRMTDENCLPLKFFEVDFGEVVSKKLHMIKQSKVLQDKLNNISMNVDSLTSDIYSFLKCDLRDISQLSSILIASGAVKSKPTLVLAECVLIYMPVCSSKDIIKWVAEYFTDSVFINYEPFNMNDSFGRTMINNLKARQCWLVGQDACQSVSTEKERFLENGWDSVVCENMWTVYNSLPDRRNIERIEFLDETELFQQLLVHYCLCIAIKETSDLNLIALTDFLS